MLLADLVKTILPVVSKMFPDQEQAQRFAHEIAKAQIDADTAALRGQLDANIESAKHASVFVAGARPAVIWGLLFMLLYNFVFHPFLLYLGVFFPEANFESLPKPIEDTETIFYFIGGLLGMGGWRSMDKAKGVARHTL